MEDEEARGEERFGLMPGELEHAGDQQEQKEEESRALAHDRGKTSGTARERSEMEVGGQKRRGSRR